MRQGEIWLLDLDPTRGAEIQKKRPVVIINDNSLGKLPLKVVVPITEWKDSYDIAPWMIKIESNELNGLSKTSSIDCFQIRSVSKERFIKKIGIIELDTLLEIKEGVRRVLVLISHFYFVLKRTNSPRIPVVSPTVT
jgi:mRNA interferase MazF